MYKYNETATNWLFVDVEYLKGANLESQKGNFFFPFDIFI